MLKQDSTVNQYIPKAEFKFFPKSETNPKLRLMIAVANPKSVSSLDKKSQKAFLNHLYFRIYCFKKYSYNEKENVYEFFYKNSESILVVLGSIKANYAELYTKANLDEQYEKIKLDQVNALKERKLAELHFILPDNIEVTKVDDAFNDVYRFQISDEDAEKLNFTTRDVFYKNDPNLIDSPSDEYQAAVAALSELFLGIDRVPTTRVVYDKAGVRKGIISAAFDDWQPLNDYIKIEVDKIRLIIQPALPDFFNHPSNVRDFRMQHYYPSEMVEKLVADGIIEVYAVCYVLANPNAHFYNVGYHNGKICYLGFNKTLAPLIKHWQTDEVNPEPYSVYRGCELDEGWEINACDIGRNFATPKVAKPFRWLDKNGFSYGNRYNPSYDETPYLAARAASAPGYYHKQFFTFLKIFSTHENDIRSCISPFVKKEKHQQAIYNFVLERQQSLLSACCESDDFCFWLLDNPDVKKQELLASFENYYVNKTIGKQLSEQEISIFLGEIATFFDNFVLEVRKLFTENIFGTDNLRDETSTSSSSDLDEDIKPTDSVNTPKNSSNPQSFFGKAAPADELAATAPATEAIPSTEYQTTYPRVVI